MDSIAPLSNQVAVVTGAARGIGEAIAIRFAHMGATVVLTARDQSRLGEVKAGIEQNGGKALVQPCDLTDEKAVAAFGRGCLSQRSEKLLQGCHRREVRREAARFHRAAHLPQVAR